MAMPIGPTSASPGGTVPIRGGGGAAPGTSGADGTDRTDGATSAPGPSRAGRDTMQLSPESAAMVAKLQARDAQVRAHEAAHMAAGGSLVQGGPSFTYQPGPDGKSYAVGGEVSIDTSAVAGDPKATLAKAQQIVAAALAPADPSGQDESVASQAEAMAAQAQGQLAANTPGGGGRPGSLLDLTA